MEGFFGFITIVGFLYLAMLLISKTTNMSIKSKYQSGSAIDPGDLDNLIEYSCSLSITILENFTISGLHSPILKFLRN